MKKIPFMTTYRKWDIVLVSFPFSDLKSTKKRPALIIGTGSIGAHPYYLILFITSKIPSELEKNDYRITTWQQSGLPRPSMVRYKIATVDAAIVLKKLGSLQSDDRKGIHTLLCKEFCEEDMGPS